MQSLNQKRTKVLELLQKQLAAGLKVARNEFGRTIKGSYVPLIKADVSRIEREIDILKTYLNL